MSRAQKNVSDFVQKHFVSVTNVSQFVQPKKHHGKQCVRNNVYSFPKAFSHPSFPAFSYMRALPYFLPIEFMFSI